MLKLLKPFFGGRETVGRYPETLIRRATDRVVEGTDPRLNLLSGYRKKLRQPVVHAIDHIVSLVDGFPEPIETNAENYGDTPLLRALFSSPSRMLELLGEDINLNRFIRENAVRSGTIRALLLAQHTTRKVMGNELVEGRVHRDVVQRVASFTEYRLVGLAPNQEKARSEMGSRAFNHLLELALEEIAAMQEQRESLNRQRSLLRRKRRALDHGSWSFEKTRSLTQTDATSLESELEEIEKQLRALGSSDRTLASHLDIDGRVLSQAEQHLWKEDMVLHLDQMNIERDANHGSARELRFQLLRNSQGARLIALPVLIPVDKLPKTGNYISEAKKYL